MSEPVINELLPVFDAIRVERLAVHAEPPVVYGAALNTCFVAGLRLEELGNAGELVLLGNLPPREVAFGAVGRFTSDEPHWEAISAAEFAGFDDPGFGRIACSVRAEPDGGAGTLLAYEVRVQSTDPASRLALLRYWQGGTPFSGVAMRSTLNAVERLALPAAVCS